MKIEAKAVGSGALFAAAAVAASHPAMAAGPEPAPSWQGFYVGANLGVSWLASAFDDSAANILGVGYGLSGSGTKSTANAAGWLGGLQAGYNWQDRNFVYGLEGDISFLGSSSASSNGNVGVGRHGYSYGYAATRSSKVDGISTFRARAGFDFDGTMPYITAGLALGEVKNTFTTGYSTTSKTSWLPGVAFGGGIEHQFTDSRWSVRGEVLWVGLKDKSLNVTPAYGASNAGTVKFSDSVTLGRIGLNYQF